MISNGGRWFTTRQLRRGDGIWYDGKHVKVSDTAEMAMPRRIWESFPEMRLRKWVRVWYGDAGNSFPAHADARWSVRRECEDTVCGRPSTRTIRMEGHGTYDYDMCEQCALDRTFPDPWQTVNGVRYLGTIRADRPHVRCVDWDERYERICGALAEFQVETALYGWQESRPMCHTHAVRTREYVRKHGWAANCWGFEDGWDALPHTWEAFSWDMA